MSTLISSRFQVFVDGKQTGNIGRWRKAPLMVSSHWTAGSDGEKFEVLSAIRKTYSSECLEHAPGEDHHLVPSQIARNEGFTELSYRRATSQSINVTIIPALLSYSPKASKFNMIDWLRRSI